MRDIARYEREYLRDYGFEEILVKYRRKKLLEILERLSPRHILEIGCGMEPLFAYLSQNSYDRFVTFEPAENFCRHAKELAAGNERIAIVNDFFSLDNGAIEKCLAMSIDFDLIICSGLLNEVERPDALLAAIKELCTIKTNVLLTVANANSFHRLLGLYSGAISDIHLLTERNIALQQHTVFDQASLQSLLNETGFIVNEISSSFIKPFTHQQMEDCLKDGIMNESILDGLYKMSTALPDVGAELFALCQAKV